MAFDPIELSRETEQIVIQGDKRKYNIFRLERFYGQMATARGVGCNLRCIPCWINPSRDSPAGYGTFYSPQEVHEGTVRAAEGLYKIMSSGIRISGCEPTIGKSHLLSLIELCQKEKKFKFFLLETNGILLGNDREYIKELAEFKDYIVIRLSLKAGNPEGFEMRTGARAEFFELPFIALRNIKEAGIDYRVASMSADPAIMPPAERRDLLKRLVSSGENLSCLDEERTDLFESTKQRLSAAGVGIESVGKRVYCPLDIGLLRSSAEQAGLSLSVQQLLEMAILETVQSPCSKCKRENPWHGHGTRDDLDPRLG